MLVAEQALLALADQLREEDSVISPHVSGGDPETPALGLLAAAGPRTREDPAAYALVIETTREGYLLHYGRPRILEGADTDLALLAGDYLYARGLERLAALGDLEAIRELADLISLSAQIHVEYRGGAEELWLACVTAVAAGPDAAQQEAKSALRRGDDDAPRALWEAAARSARAADLGPSLERAAEAIGFQPQ